VDRLGRVTTLPAVLVAVGELLVVLGVTLIVALVVLVVRLVTTLMEAHLLLGW
jgi:hypothetical protein